MTKSIFSSLRNGFLFPSSLKDIFTGGRILGWQVFFWGTFKILFNCLLASVISFSLCFFAMTFTVVYLLRVPNLKVEAVRPPLPSTHTGLLCPQHALSPRAAPLIEGTPCGHERGPPKSASLPATLFLYFAVIVTTCPQLTMSTLTWAVASVTSDERLAIRGITVPVHLMGHLHPHSPSCFQDSACGFQ